jgi:hypothetical protein
MTVQLYVNEMIIRIFRPTTSLLHDHFNKPAILDALASCPNTTNPTMKSRRGGLWRLAQGN